MMSHPSYPTGADAIREFVKNAPSGPGVYRMLNARLEILYIGKAKNLKKRIANYAHSSRLEPRLQHMVAQVFRVEVTTTRSEAEALLLEANLVRHHHPRFNIELKDDKSFPYIAIDSRHEFPRIFKHRGERHKDVTYFGPFPSAGAVNETLNILQRSFLLRPCADSVFAARTRPCLEYQIKRCSAPCVRKITAADYENLVTQAREFLSGKSRHLQEFLEKEMQDASAAMDYEKAAIFRDRIKALTHIQARQTLFSGIVEDADVFALHQEHATTAIQVFFFRGGHMLGTRAFFPGHTEGYSAGDILEAFLVRFYQAHPPPAELILSHAMPDPAVFKEALEGLYHRAVSLTTPQRGEKLHLVRMATDNAREALAQKLQHDSSQQEIFEQLATIFGLDEPPQRIEVYDNSHISGRHAVGAMIAAGLDGFITSGYRRFTIKNNPHGDVRGGDDYAMLREVLTRRFKRLKSGQEKPETPWPDLVLIDGGAGQLRVAQEVFADLGLGNLTFACIAKGPDRNAGREVFYQPDKEPFQLPPSDPALFYLQRLRDEAHRFAITSHRRKRSAAMRQSPLDHVEGVGATRKKSLLYYFGSAAAVAQASVQELAKVDGISKTLAQKIYDQLHSH